jgi:serine/threonine-protein kinase
MLAGYRLVRTLGKGGLGEVYEAIAPDGLIVALKAFKLRDDDQGLVASAFVREANLGARLAHPDIVKVLDTGCHADYAFLAMEFVPGHDLRKHTLPAHRLPLAQVLRTAERIARALAAAHAIHVIHRDVKPGNVLVHGPTDIVKVTDFGLARLGDAFRSRTGIVAGTPGYMPPEQLAEGVVGPYSDLYSLGALMFELLTSRLPFEAHTLGALLRQVANRTAPLVSTLQPDIPPAVAGLVAELLERQPQRRPADASEVADRLARLRAGLACGPKSRG